MSERPQQPRTRIVEAPRNPQRGYLEARPGDVAGRTDLWFVDVREEAELTGDFGHLEGVRHQPMETLEAYGLPQASADTPVVLVCDNGRRSARCARSLMETHGFTEVYVLVGGMLRWTAEERPVSHRPTWIPEPAY